jgi:hypothetical protein
MGAGKCSVAVLHVVQAKECSTRPMAKKQNVLKLEHEAYVTYIFMRSVAIK